MAAWKWSNFWASRRASGRRLVHINMDETAIRFWEKSGSQGYIVVPPRMLKKHFLERENGATLSQRRSVCSYVAFISDDDRINELLPQIIIVNEHTISASDVAAVEKPLALSTTLFVMRRKSAWVTGELLQEIIKLLHRCLESQLEEIHALLLLDCSPVHATERIARACARAGFLLHFVPSNMTGIMQPLDVYTFADFKRAIREEYEEEAIKSGAGKVKPLAVLELTFRCIVRVVQGKAWRHAFLGCGFGGKQFYLGERIRRRMSWPKGCPPVGDDVPSLHELHEVWCSRRSIPIGWLFHRAVSGAGAGVGLNDGDSTAATVASGRQSAWHGRLRSSSFLGRAAAASSSKSAGPPWRPRPRAPLPKPAPVAPPSSSLSPGQVTVGTAAPIALRPGLPVGRPLLPRRRPSLLDLPAPT